MSRRPALLLLPVWVVVVLGGLACLVAAMAEVGPRWLDDLGAIVVATAYATGLALRTGGRPVISGSLALAIGAAAVLVDRDLLRAGAAVLTCAVSAVLAVMSTKPAVRFVDAVRECCIALAVAAVGAFATVGFAPVISLARFEYAALALALVAVFVVVYRLGAGLHGLGRRGVAAVPVAAAVLAATLLYAELVRRYGTTAAVETMLDAVRWSRENLGASPRPIVALVGVPALVWGCHMRARRRQGWWLCAFGVAATVPVAASLVNPAISLLESTLAIVYALIVGAVLGYLIVRLDLVLTGSHGRGGRRLEEAAAVRPEPGRGSALL